METYHLIYWGLIGGIAPEFIAFYKLRKKPTIQLPAHYHRVFFWTITFLMIVAGGGLVYLYTVSGAVLTQMLAVNIGATAPLIIGKFSENIPEIS